MDKRRFNEAWERYKKNTLKPGDPPKREYDLKVAFYSGGYAVIKEIVDYHNPEKNPDGAKENIVILLFDEIRAYVDAIVRIARSVKAKWN